MHVGLGMNFQALDGKRSDAEVYAFELELAARAEALGYDSIWTPEHHFTDYMMTPNVPQFLAWVAGQTRRIRLGTMVTVLPWHDPVRVAEQFTLLDHLSKGRAILGVGRGLGRVEFEAFRVEMGESRRRFTEYTEAVVQALETGVIEYHGELYRQPRTRIRPGPYASFKGRRFASSNSPDSLDLIARLGLGAMIIAQKPWDKVIVDLDRYRRRFLEVNGEEAPKPVLAMFVCVHEDPNEAERMRRVYLQRYARSTVEHYEFGNVGFADIQGYEYYAGLARSIAKLGLDGFNDILADLQAWGTPEQVAETLLRYVDLAQAGGLLVQLCFGGMEPEVAQANFDLFAEQVLPRLKAHDVGGDIGVPYSPDVQYAAAE
jgi:alkanesulfonate monooxygenase SsuD/methylene tetrahydromethanopterin reductase-like flavin-dependent oxidoreductase (luciferase family)